MPKIEPRWNIIQKGVLYGLEGVIAKQQVMVMQARATVEALKSIHAGLERQEGEAEAEFNAHKSRHENAIFTTEQDLILKEEVLANLAAEYESLLEEGMDINIQPLDTSILEDSNEKPKGCSCGPGSV